MYPQQTAAMGYKHIGCSVFHWLACVLTVAMRDTFDKRLKKLDGHRTAQLVQIEGCIASKIRSCAESSVARAYDMGHYVKDNGFFSH